MRSKECVVFYFWFELGPEEAKESNYEILVHAFACSLFLSGATQHGTNYNYSSHHYKHIPSSLTTSIYKGQKNKHTVILFYFIFILQLLIVIDHN